MLMEVSSDRAPESVCQGACITSMRITGGRGGETPRLGAEASSRSPVFFRSVNKRVRDALRRSYSFRVLECEAVTYTVTATLR